MKRHLEFCLRVSLLVCVCSANTFPQSAWFWQSPLPQGNALSSIALTEARSGTTVGSQGTILRTTGGGAICVGHTHGIPYYLFGVSFAASEEGKNEESIFVVNVSYLSRYVWRGFDLNGRSSVLQPSMWIGLPLDFSIDVSGSIGISRKQLDEVDVALHYQRTLFPEWFEMSVALSTYQYLGTEAGIYLTGSTGYANSQEIIINFITRKAPLEISIEYGRGLGGKDGGDNKGNYASISFSKDWKLGTVTMNSAVSGTYLDQYDIPRKLTDISVKNSSTLNVGTLTFQPNVSVVYLPSPQISNGNNEDKIVLWGISVSHSW